MGEWKVDQNTIHIETRNDLARTVVIYVQACSKESTAAMGIKKNLEFKLRDKRRKITIFFSEILKTLTPCSRTPEKLEVPAEAASPCIATDLIPTAQTPTQNVAVSQVGGRRSLALSERTLSLIKRKRQMEAFESRRCILREGRNRVHDTLQIEEFILGIIIIWHTHPCQLALS